MGTPASALFFWRSMQMEVRVHKWMAAAVAALMVARIFAEEDLPTVIPELEVPSATEMGFDMVELSQMMQG